MKPYYEDKWVTLYHGDCLQITDWLAADVLVTDPPYGMRLGAGIGTYGRRGRISKSRKVAGDESTGARDAALVAWGVNRPAIVFGTWRIARPSGSIRHRVIWDKAGMTSGSIRAAVMTRDEEVYFIGSGWRASAPPLMSVITTHESRSRAVADHPTPKPLSLMRALIDRCPPGAIADPFAGSGSTLVAAKALGRKAIGVELEERYCEIAARRLAQDVLDFGGAA